MGTGPQSKGTYKCLVSNKYGEVKSQGKKYCKLYTFNPPMPPCLYNNTSFLDPFVRELKQKDLRDDEISKLIGR